MFRCRSYDHISDLETYLKMAQIKCGKIVFFEKKSESVESVNLALKSEVSTALFSLFTPVKILFGKRGHP